MAGSPVRAPRRYHATDSVTTMPAGQASIFFTLPAELRLEVYKLLLEDCLENGFAMDVAGLFHSCRQIQQEIENEFMSAARPLLTAKSTWETAEKFPGVLGIRVLPKLNSRASDLSIKLPIQPTFEAGDFMTFTQQREIWDASLILREVFGRNWSSLTLSLDFKSMPTMTISQIDQVYRKFFYHGDSNSSADFHFLKHIPRVVLCYGERPKLLDAMKCLMDAFVWAYSHAWIAKDSNRIREGSVVKRFEAREPGWRLIIDSKEGLNPVMDAITQLTIVGYRVKQNYNPFNGVSDRLLLEFLESLGIIRFTDTGSNGSSDSESESSDTESDESSLSVGEQSSGSEAADSSEPESEASEVTQSEEDRSLDSD